MPSKNAVTGRKWIALPISMEKKEAAVEPFISKAELINSVFPKIYTVLEQIKGELSRILRREAAKIKLAEIEAKQATLNKLYQGKAVKLDDFSSLVQSAVLKRREFQNVAQAVIDHFGVQVLIYNIEDYIETYKEDLKRARGPEEEDEIDLTLGWIVSLETSRAVLVKIQAGEAIDPADYDSLMISDEISAAVYNHKWVGGLLDKKAIVVGAGPQAASSCQSITPFSDASLTELSTSIEELADEEGIAQRHQPQVSPSE